MILRVGAFAVGVVDRESRIFCRIHHSVTCMVDIILPEYTKKSPIPIHKISKTKKNNLYFCTFMRLSIEKMESESKDYRI